MLAPLRKFSRNARHFLFSSAILIPLTSPENWHHLKFTGTKQNTISYSEAGLSMQVENSSSPLVYFLPKPEGVTGFELVGDLQGLPNIPEGKTEWDKKADDYALRIGVAEEGGDTLNFFERLFAPHWIRDLIRIQPERKLSFIRFYNVAQRKEAGANRPHPKHKWIDETVIVQMKAPGPLQVSQSLGGTRSIFAVWVQSDGDDTRSKFHVTLKSLKLLTE